jgi:ABC-type polysaccharide/polyol phosphate transport system ATPase subunit
MSHTTVEMENVALRFPRSSGILAFIKSFFKKSNDGFTALEGINLTVKSGEVVGVIGKNGSGKSTLLRVIAGIYPTDEGECRVRGDISLLSGLGTGFSRHLTGRENAILYGSILGHSIQTMEELMAEIIDFSELGEFIDQPLRTYSAGMKARLGLAVASAIQPDILLVDEVLGVGDPNFREKSMERILGMVEDAGTVVIVSHSFALMKKICSRMVLIHKGKILSEGEPESVISAYYEANPK